MFKKQTTVAHKAVLLVSMISLLLLLIGSDKVFPSWHVAAQETTPIPYQSLAITQATISPDPVVGQIATLSIEVVSPRYGLP